jgi:ParB family chromosome partitioning protein
MSKKTDIAAGFLGAIAQGKEQAKTDRRLAQDARLGRAVTLLDPAQVRPRTDNTRPARAGHVVALAESIAAAGLVQSPAVDKAHRLIAGLNRLEACRLLMLPNKDRLGFAKALDGYDDELDARIAALPEVRRLPEPLNAGKLPVRVLNELDANEDPAAALAAEAAENTARKAYTLQEVRDLAQRLRAAGYREIVGRPKKGQKALRPALELVLGQSASTVRRILGKKKAGESAGDKHAASLRRLQGACRAVAQIPLPDKKSVPHLRRVLAAADELARALPDAADELANL